MNGRDFIKYVGIIGILLLITNFAAFSIAYFTEKRHKNIAKTIKRLFRMQQS